VEFIDQTESIYLLKQQIPKLQLGAIFSYESPNIAQYLHEYFHKLQANMVTVQVYEEYIKELQQSLDDECAKLAKENRTPKEISLLTSAKKGFLEQHQVLCAAYAQFRQEKADKSKSSVSV